MAVGMLLSIPGFTQEHYEQVNQKLWGHYPMEPADAPSGLILHSAGPAPDGWYVYDIWETREDFQRFAEERVGPAMQSVVGDAAGGPPVPDFYEVASVVKV